MGAAVRTGVQSGGDAVRLDRFWRFVIRTDGERTFFAKVFANVFGLRPS